MNMKDNVIAAVIGLSIGLAVISPIAALLIFDSNTMEEQHCQKNGETRESYYIQYMYGDKGQIIGSYPVLTEENKYTCDDGIRWR